MPRVVLTDCFHLTEHNDWEGETWHFYAPLSGNEEAVQVIEDYLARVAAIHEAGGVRSPYEGKKEKIHLPTIANLPAGSGYMAEHNIIRKLDLDKIRAEDWSFRKHGSDRIHDPLYKGGLRKFGVKVMTYECFEVCQHDKGHEVVRGCGSTHKTPKAAAKHGKSHFRPFIASSKPVVQLRLEIRDELGKVVHVLQHSTIYGRGCRARWVESKEQG